MLMLHVPGMPGLHHAGKCELAEHMSAPCILFAYLHSALILRRMI